jgi:predicted AlkP superfamily phosphohydrolase/phosphomutase
MDGMDPALLKRFMAEGLMPTFQSFLSQGSYRNLRTTMPPQSPVAWSSFISGCQPGGHGIFDFVHRDPHAITPHLSTSRVMGDSKSISLGSWQLPISGGEMRLLRQGPSLWSTLEAHDIPSTVFQIPANYPVVSSSTRVMSGMGTPDLLGGYGVCSYYTDDSIAKIGQEGVHINRVKLTDHLLRSELIGPRNHMKVNGEETTIPFTLRRDPWEPVARISIQDHTIILRKGEWSEWLPIRFEILPGISSIAGMVRIYLKQVHPNLKLYISPINVDPFDPVFPIGSPEGYSRELAEAAGRFYTQGLPADTKALQNHILNDEEFFDQAKLVLEENMRVLHHELNRYKEGLLFYYFSSTDQCAHMLLRSMDPSHPQYRPDAAPDVQNAIRYLYRRMDDALRETLAKVGSDTTVMVLSDHGFCSFTRELHLGTWLANEGFTSLNQPAGTPELAPYESVNWQGSQAYALGINGIYLNLKGREPNGAVDPQQAPLVKQQIIERLEKLTDPVSGERIVERVYDSQQLYTGPFMAVAPDLLIGYRPGYRASDEAILGVFKKEVVGDRNNKWASDHCVDPSFVPGVLLCNREVTTETPAIWDLAPSILKVMGVPAPAEMTGKAVLG